MWNRRYKKKSNYIIIASGFRELGQKGAKLENKLVMLARKYNLIILGHNSLDVFISDDGFYTIFVEHGSKSFVKNGKITFIVQNPNLLSELSKINL